MSALDGAVVEALVIILAVAACRWFNRRRPAVLPAGPLAVPDDPYAIAWLRGGSTAVLQLAVYELVRGSRLAVAPASPAEGDGAARAQAPLLVPLPGRAGEEALPAAARQLLQLVTGACDQARLASLAPDLEPGFADCQRRLRAQGLLLSPGQRLAGWAVTALGMAAVTGVPLWHILNGAAAAQGSLVAMASLAVSGLGALWLAGTPEPRLSPRGRACLVSLTRGTRAAPGRQHAQRWTAAAVGDQGRGGAQAPASAPALMAVACSGPAALNGTPYAALVPLLDPALVPPGPPGFQHSPAEEGGDAGRAQAGGDQR